MEANSARAEKKIRVLIADNSRIHTQLLSCALQRDPELSVVNWDWNPSSLIPTILAHHIDVLAVSSTFGARPNDGLKAVRDLRSLHPKTRTIVLLDCQEDEPVINAFRAGARGVLSRDASVEMFCKCIHCVHCGEIWADSRGVSLAVEALASAPTVQAVNTEGLSLLSKRELEVVHCVVQGLTNREIAQRLGLSQHTVKNYLFRVFDKLGVSSRIELLSMTLSQNNNHDQALLAAVTTKIAETVHEDEANVSFFEKAAERGVPSAQLALAQAYLARRATPDDLVQAYMWYLIATERALQLRALLTRTLTTQQIEEAQERASRWLASARTAPVLGMEATAGPHNQLHPAHDEYGHPSKVEPSHGIPKHAARVTEPVRRSEGAIAAVAGGKTTGTF
jgi:two-component system, NarL family, nitrate/nitrite response regulator NarL